MFHYPHSALAVLMAMKYGLKQIGYLQGLSLSLSPCKTHDQDACMVSQIRQCQTPYCRRDKCFSYREREYFQP